MSTSKAPVQTDTADDAQAQKHPQVSHQATQTPVLLSGRVGEHSLAKQNWPMGNSLSSSLNRHRLHNTVQAPGALATSAQQAQDCGQLQAALVSPFVTKAVLMQPAVHAWFARCHHHPPIAPVPQALQVTQC